MEGLSADEAIAWGRARADKVFIRAGGGDYHSAGASQVEFPPWPPPGLPPLTRRRPPGEEWRDRTAADEPIAWSVQATLEPEDGSFPDRDRWDGAIAALAGAAGADGWDADGLEAAQADFERARRRARPGQDIGWSSYHRAAYRIRLTEQAPTQALAIEQARRRLRVPGGWRLELTACPAG